MTDDIIISVRNKQKLLETVSASLYGVESVREDFDQKVIDQIIYSATFFISAIQRASTPNVGISCHTYDLALARLQLADIAIDKLLESVQFSIKALMLTQPEDSVND